MQFGKLIKILEEALAVLWVAEGRYRGKAAADRGTSGERLREINDQFEEGKKRLNIAIIWWV